MQMKGLSKIAAMVSMLTTSVRKKWIALIAGGRQLATALSSRLLSMAAMFFYVTILAVCFLPLIKELSLSDAWTTLTKRFYHP
jgi:hypothetical protein